ncbi:MAG: hypothetical protein CMJ58_01235 [Planctomycetaceae bacterium]|nr:hypothetical protein [Planctomycetaceae bacterium]
MNRSPRALTLVELLIVVAIIGVIIALMSPFHRGGGREPARQMYCRKNLKQIALAMLAYAEEHGTLPPAYTVDEAGNRLHSWRTLILPYLDNQRLYESINLTKSWDDPANGQARATALDIYLCPSANHDQDHTTYLAVVGPDFAFAGETPRALNDVTDDAGGTLLVVEARSDQAVHWMSPHDLTEEGAVQISLAGDRTYAPHAGVFQVAFLDGAVVSLHADVDRDLLHGLLTIAGGEDVSDALE